MVVQVQQTSRAIADLQDAIADALPQWVVRLTGADQILHQWAKDRREYAESVELAWWAHQRGEFEPWNRLFP